MISFSFCGQQVMYDKYSGRSRRFAFVMMKTVEDANAAIEKLNGTVRLTDILYGKNDIICKGTVSISWFL